VIGPWREQRKRARRVTIRLRADGSFVPGFTPLPFNLEGFLEAPLVARLATRSLVQPDAGGPVVRPVWFLWEARAFWVITGPWSSLEAELRRDPRFCLVVDTCDLQTGTVRQVIARGRGRVQELDIDRARRKLIRYLGSDESVWDPRFALHTDRAAWGNRLATLSPTRLDMADLSYRPSHSPPGRNE
jgi:hypothetical protein